MKIDKGLFMSEKIKQIIEEIEALEDKLKEEIALKEEHISYEIKNGYVHFEQDIISKQKENMKKIIAYLKDVPFLHLISSPFIYIVILPALVLDVMLFVYQQVIFRIYKIDTIQRSDYIVFDRHYLAYLNPIEKINCLYCSYFNGLIHYASEISAKTELYFCPIKHAKKIAYKHRYYKDFLAYGDERDFQEKFQELREKVQKDSR